jgi:hypothetical protein
MIQAASAEAHISDNRNFGNAAYFLHALINSCIIDMYFTQHMAERRLSITKAVELLLPKNIDTMNRSELAQTAVNFSMIANESKHPIRNMLLRHSSESPNLLRIIVREVDL